MPYSGLTATDEGHLVCHHGHEGHIDIQRKIRHIEYRLCHMPDIEGRLDSYRAVGLRRPFLPGDSHIGGSIADVDLPTANIK